MTEDAGMRLQVLNLPAPADEYPFLLVLDNAPPQHMEELTKTFDAIAKRMGAVGGIVFTDEVYVS